MKSQDIAIVGILLAVGAIARFAANIIPGPIVPNFVIVFYCLAIMLVVPRFTEAIGIGLIGGIVSALISHSLFPPANLISEIFGAVTCILVFLALKERIRIAPAISTLLATFASGISFLLIVVVMVMIAPDLFSESAINKVFSAGSIMAFLSVMLVTIVIPTAILNTLIAQLLYLPAAKVLSKGKEQKKNDTKITPDEIDETGDSIGSNESMFLAASYGYTYPGSTKPALHDITLSINKGELILITGPTAAGKTTLCMALSGVLKHETDGKSFGHLSFKKRPVGSYNGIAELSKHIAMVFDDADSQLIFTSVTEEIASGTGSKFLDESEIEKRVSTVLSLCGISNLSERQPNMLSGGQKQRVAIAAALAMDTDVIILDEPTSELDVKATEKIISILKGLRDNGKTVIVVDHSIEGYRGVADRVYELKEGKILKSGDFEAIYPEPQGTLCALYDESDLKTYVPEKGIEPVISVKEVTKNYGDVKALGGVNFDIFPGEFVALLGENGSGKTTLVKHFNGLIRPDSGTIKIGPYEVSSATTIDLVKQAGLVFQNPDTMLFADTAREEISFGLINTGKTDNEETIREVLDMVGLSGREEAYPRHFSRGERQRLAVAAIIAMKPSIIILDEPTTGLDEEESDHVMKLMKKLQKQGHTIIMVTHNMRIAKEYSDRIIAMADGRLTGDYVIDHGVQA